MTRRPLLLISLIAFTAAAVLLAWWVMSVSAQPISRPAGLIRSCPTPARTFETLVACEKTMTAQARTTATATKTATVTPSPVVVIQTQTPAVTPTRITGTEKPGCWVVGQGVAIKFEPCSFGVTQVPFSQEWTP